MKERFQEYLIKCGYSLTSPAGNPSTVYDYAKRIDKVCQNESVTWTELAENIDVFVAMYDTGGNKVKLGKSSHSAVINALKRFSEFLNAQ